MLFLVLPTLFLLVIYVISIQFYSVGWNRLRTAESPAAKAQTRVSIVVAVRDEEQCIGACIQSLLDQDYPANLYKIIVVDDYSADGTADVVRSIDEPRLHLIRLEHCPGRHGANTPNKKAAIMAGVQQATGELIATTDGDCTAPKGWLSAMVRMRAHTGAKLLAGPVGFPEEEGLLQLFQSADMMSMCGIAGACIARNKPILCNGANLAYEREAFLEAKAYEDNAAVPSGDDLFLLYAMHKAYPGSVAFVKDRQALVTTRYETSFGALFEQRKRWVSKTSQLSNRGVQALMTANYLFHLSIVFFVIAGVLRWDNVSLAFGLGLLFCKMAGDYLFMNGVIRFYERPAIRRNFVLLEIMHLIYVVVIGALAPLSRYTWKGNTVKPAIFRQP